MASAALATAPWTDLDQADVQRAFVHADSDGLATAELVIDGIHCAGCVRRIERALPDLGGRILVNAATGRAQLTWPAAKPLSPLLAAIESLGFAPRPFYRLADEALARNAQRQSLGRLLVAGLGMMQVMMYAVALYAGAFQGISADIEQLLRSVSMLVATPVVLYAGAPFFAAATQQLRARSPGMDVPVALAIGAAYGFSVINTLRGTGEVYFDSATMFVFFLTVGRALEQRSRNRLAEVSASAEDLVPRLATRLVNGKAATVTLEQLRVGDRILVKPGAVFPGDGLIFRGRTRVDESLVTGESDGQYRAESDRVLAGTTNLQDAVEIELQALGADTQVAQIGKLLAAAQLRKPRFVTLANRIASGFVVGVLSIAAAVALIWSYLDPSRVFEIVLATLVVTCPCALALATPVSFSAALGLLAKRGVLFRNPDALLAINQVDTVVFDKTGTLTTRGAQISDCIPAAGQDRSEMVAIAAAMEARSEHPLAEAFRDFPTDPRVTDVRNVESQGLEAKLDGTRIRLGRASFAASSSNSGPGTARGRSIFLGDGNTLWARFELAETLRPETDATLAELAKRGLAVAIASGDDPSNVSKLAGSLNISEWHGAMTPATKLALIEDFRSRGRTVAVIGDGVNDAPVLGAADVSFAVAEATDLTRNVADAALLGESLRPVLLCLDLAQGTRRVVAQNLGWAIGYNLVALPLAATGLLAPWAAAIGMSASSLLVTLNALRLGRDASVDGAQKTGQIEVPA